MKHNSSFLSSSCLACRWVRWRWAALAATATVLPPAAKATSGRGAARLTRASRAPETGVATVAAPGGEERRRWTALYSSGLAAGHGLNGGFY
uniref:Secreted protein n=1 Tax=Aegilops tauschii subsp. strangulata TaxID=200361 RepID=A0A453RIC5_AEGTS